MRKKKTKNCVKSCKMFASFGFFYVSLITYLQIYLQICKEITNFANEL
jgi:hypothetical protein